MIEAGVRPNSKNKDTIPPLILILKVATVDPKPSYRDCVKILLKNKVDINQPDDKTGDTPLIMSIGKEAFNIFSDILSRHPNVNARNCNGETALYSIVTNQKIDSRRYEYLEKLIEYKPPEESQSDSKNKKKKNDNLPCDMTMRYKQGKTILHVAIENENRSKRVIEKIIESSGLDIDVEDDNGNTPLHIAALKNADSAIIEMLIKRGCDPTQPNKTGRTPFSLADPETAPKIAEWMNDPEAVENREQRKIDKHLCEEEEMKERIEKRDGKLQQSPPNRKPDGKESRTPKSKRKMLLAMTLGNGTLRNSQARTVRGDYTTSDADVLSKSKKMKRIEARPWGGSKETSMFQRTIRLKIREMKSDMMKELDEIRKSIHELRKTITGESDDEDYDNNNTEIDANSLSAPESANTSQGQINNDDINTNQISNDEQSQSFDQDQVQNENVNPQDDNHEIVNNVELVNNDEINQNFQENAELPNGHEEEINSDIKIPSDVQVEEKNTDSELIQILGEDNNSGEHENIDTDNLDGSIDNLING